MAFTQIFADFYAAFSIPEIHAEAPAEAEEKDEGDGEAEESKEEADEGKEGGEESAEDGEGGDDGGDEGGEGEDDGGEEEEEEEEEDEPVDPKPKLEEGMYHLLRFTVMRGVRTADTCLVERLRWRTHILATDLGNPFPTSNCSCQTLLLLRLSYQEPIKLMLEFAECARSAQCAPFKHHFDECAERVQEQEENPDHKGPKEDCVEECEFNPHFSCWKPDSRGHSWPSTIAMFPNVPARERGSLGALVSTHLLH